MRTNVDASLVEVKTPKVQVGNGKKKKNKFRPNEKLSQVPRILKNSKSTAEVKMS